MTDAPASHGRRTGLLFALAGFVLLSTGDAVVKTMAGEWPPTAIAALRYILGAVGLAGLLGAREGRPGFVLPALPIQLLRGFGVAMATVGFFAAIFVMPLATATAITFTSPIITALLAPFVLGERLARGGLIALALAFAGTVVVLRPSLDALGWQALLPLMSALGMSLLVIGNRLLAGRASALAMQFGVAGIAAPLLVVAAVAGHASGIAQLEVGWPEWSVALRCAIVALTASTAHWLIYLGTERSSAADVAPMTYVQLLVAIGLGWVVFGDVPDALALTGAAMIVAAGLMLWHGGRGRASR